MNNLIHFFFIYYSTSSQHIEELGSAAQTKGEEDKNVAYKIAMLGDSAVGKSSLTYQFTTSEYICAYDLSLGEFVEKVFKCNDVIIISLCFRTYIPS